MRRIVGAACTISCLFLSFATVAVGQHRDLDLERRAEGADRVVTATVSEVVARAARNEFGDPLIVSRATLVVDEVLKGAPTDTLALYVEGGTIGDLTMQVSDLPTIREGDRAVFFVTRTRSGLHIPHRRGRGILIVDRDGYIKGTHLPLSEVRFRVLQALR